MLTCRSLLPPLSAARGVFLLLVLSRPSVRSLGVRELRLPLRAFLSSSLEVELLELLASLELLEEELRPLSRLLRRHLSRGQQSASLFELQELLDEGV